MRWIVAAVFLVLVVSGALSAAPPANGNGEVL
jgi:hypothetical protein